MGWMPAKAWTSEQPLSGYRHFERVMTGGRGSFHVEFSHYEELPAHLADKVAKSRQEANAAS